jgi:hypothetical protein
VVLAAGLHNLANRGRVPALAIMSRGSLELVQFSSDGA